MKQLLIIFLLVPIILNAQLTMKKKVELPNEVDRKGFGTPNLPKSDEDETPHDPRDTCSSQTSYGKNGMSCDSRKTWSPISKCENTCATTNYFGSSDTVTENSNSTDYFHNIDT